MARRSVHSTIKFPARMFRVILLCVLAFIATSSFAIVNPGPAFPPTKGQIWPKPQSENKTISYFTVPKHFVINIAGETCEILKKAVWRYKNIIARMYRLVDNNLSRHGAVRQQVECDDLSSRIELGPLQRLKVNLSQPCEAYPHLDMTESYELIVADESLLTSTSIWGVLRGLESFSQLLYLPDDYSELRINETNIRDYPRYAHRGLLLDTSRHYISVPKILKLIDAMAYNKMNVFHWHIVDDQSFPYVSTRFPNLSIRGAYHSQRAVYTPQSVSLVIQHARHRGIRVVPEFDVPGHTRSWGEAYPELLVQCFSSSGIQLGLGPMNPIRNQTYKFLKEIFEEVKAVFPDQYLHIGGDEVEMSCWANNPKIRQYMRENNLTSTDQLHALFMSSVLPQLSADTEPIVWQEVVDNGVKLPNGSLVQIWKSSYSWNILKVLRAGYRVLYSTCWYLDHLSSGGDWKDYYDCDPRAIVGDDKLAANIIGGEACMWSEVVDDNNVISRVWPRASATAEKLWSAEGRRTAEVVNRLEEHTCRLARRGILAQPPSGPGYCLTAP